MDKTTIETYEWIASIEYLFCKCGAQFSSLEALLMHIKASHIKGDN
jgi:hypothetical protein